jgi:truncated hemoglobin YjbI
MPDKPASLYTRLGGYDAIAAMVDDLLPRLRSDELLSRFWVSPRSVDTHNRERQLAVDFIAAAAGGPTFYLGRDMKASHKGMGITKADYAAFMRCRVHSGDGVVSGAKMTATHPITSSASAGSRALFRLIVSPGAPQGAYSSKRPDCNGTQHSGRLITPPFGP